MKRFCEDHELTRPGADCVMRDGQTLRVPVNLIDSACGCGTTIADSATPLADANYEAGRRTLAAMQDFSQRVQAHVDHNATKDAQRQRAIDADPSASAYQRMVAGMQFGGAQ